MRFIQYFILSVLCFLLVSSPVFASSLYDVQEEDIPVYGDGDTLYPMDNVLPDYALDASGDFSLVPDETQPSVSGGDFVTQSEVEDIITYAMADAYSVNVSVADAYLSSAIVEVFSRVMNGLPMGTHYAAYRSSLSDSSEGYLIYSRDASVDGNYLLFPAGSSMVHYYRESYSSGYQSYYYKYDVMQLSDDYRLPFGSGQLLYTDLINGYPVLPDVSDKSVSQIVVLLILSLGILFILFRRR